MGLAVPAEGYTSEAAVMGVAEAGAVPASSSNTSSGCVAPVRPFLLYNTWYDLQNLVMNHDNTLERVLRLAKLLEPYGLHLDSFVLDDGWTTSIACGPSTSSAFPEALGTSRGAGGHRQPPGNLVRTDRRL